MCLENQQHVTPKGEWLYVAQQPNGSGQIRGESGGYGKRFMLGQGFRATALCWKNFSNITQGTCRPHVSAADVARGEFRMQFMRSQQPDDQKSHWTALSEGGV